MAYKGPIISETPPGWVTVEQLRDNLVEYMMLQSTYAELANEEMPPEMVREMIKSMTRLAIAIYHVLAGTNLVNWLLSVNQGNSVVVSDPGKLVDFFEGDGIKLTLTALPGKVVNGQLVGKGNRVTISLADELTESFTNLLNQYFEEGSFEFTQIINQYFEDNVTIINNIVNQYITQVGGGSTIIQEQINNSIGGYKESYLIDHTTNTEERVDSSWTVIPWNEQVGEFKAVVLVRSKVTHTIITVSSLLSFDYSDPVDVVLQSDLITDTTITLVVGIDPTTNVLYSTVSNMPTDGKRIHFCYERCVLSERPTYIYATGSFILDNPTSDITAYVKIEASGDFELNTNIGIKSYNQLEAIIPFNLSGVGDIRNLYSLYAIGQLSLDSNGHLTNPLMFAHGTLSLNSSATLEQSIIQDCDIFVVNTSSPGKIYTYNPNTDESVYRFTAPIVCSDIVNTSTKLWLVPFEGYGNYLIEYNITLNPFTYEFSRNIYGFGSGHGGNDFIVLPLLGPGLGISYANDIAKEYHLVGCKNKGSILYDFYITEGNDAIVTELFFLGSAGDGYNRIITGDIVYTLSGTYITLTRSLNLDVPAFVTEYDYEGNKIHDISTYIRHLYGLFFNNGNYYAVVNNGTYYKIDFNLSLLIFAGTLGLSCNGTSQNIHCTSIETPIEVSGQLSLTGTGDIIGVDSWELLLEFQTNSPGTTTFDPSITASSGEYKWDVGGVEVLGTSVSMTLDGTTKTVKLYGKNTPTISQLLMNNDNIVGGIDLANAAFASATYIHVGNNSLLTLINVNPSPTALLSFLYVNDCDITVLDLSSYTAFSNNTYILAQNNSDLTSVIFNSSITGMLTTLWLQSCNITGVLDLTMWHSLSSVGASISVNANNLLTSILLYPSLTGQIHLFSASVCNLTGTLDVSMLTNWKILAGASGLQLSNNPNLTVVTVPSSPISGQIKEVNLYNCGLTGSLDLSCYNSFGTGGGFRLFGNSLTNVVFNSSITGTMSAIDLTNNSLSSVDLSMFINWEVNGIIFAYNNNSLNAIIMPIMSSGTIYWIHLGLCNFTSLDISGIIFASTSCRLQVQDNSLLDTFVFPITTSSFTIFQFHNTILGYIDFTGITNLTNINSCGIRLDSIGADVVDVNRYLYDLDNLSVSGYTSRTINIAGTNAAPDSSSGGYDGLAAKTSLESKGFTVTTN